MTSIENTVLFQSGGYPAVIIGAIVIIALTAIIAKVLAVLIHKVLVHGTNGEIGGSIVINIARVAVWAIGIALALNVCLGFDVAVLWGALGIGGIAISLGLQNTISNLIGGFQVSLSHDIAIGDWVMIGSLSGEVKDITWRVMKLHDEYGNDYIIPNSVLNSTAVTVLTPSRKVIIPLVLSRQADIADIGPHVVIIASRALDESDMRFAGREPIFAVESTAVDCINASIICYVKRECQAELVSDCVMEPALSYLRSMDALAICGA